MKIVPAIAGETLPPVAGEVDETTLAEALFENPPPASSEEISPENRRGEKRLAFSLSLPLIGWRGEMKSIFKYRPLDVSPRGMRLFIEGDGTRAIAQREDVDLCLPFLLDAEFLNLGTVRWADEVGEDFLCGITLSHRPHVQYPVAFDFSSGLPVRSGSAQEQPDVVHRFLKRALDDAVFIKRSLILYFSHLAPLLARLPAHQKQVDLRVTGEKIGENIQVLQSLSASIAAIDSPESRHALLENFRRAILPETEESALRSLDGSLEVAPHLRSIRQAERKLALHYNAAVLLVEGFANPPATVDS